MTIENAFNVAVVIFTVANLAAMGLELDLRQTLTTLQNAKAVALIVLWGWVVGPALAWLIIRIVPLSEGHAAGLLLISLAPTAPFFPLMVRRARGDMSFAGAFMLLTTLGVVLFLPLLAPLLIEGLTVEIWSLAQPLLLMVLLPLLVGGAIRLFAPKVANTIFPAVKKIGVIFLLFVLTLTLVLYGDDMGGALGSFAPGSQVLFLLVITLLSYTVGLGLKQEQRSGMALGMCTRNIAAVFAAYFGITNPPPGLFVMIILVVPIALVVALVAARIFATRVRETVEGTAS